MITVVHLRGTCGSGKTTLLKALRDDPRGRWVPDGKRMSYSPVWNLQLIDHDGIPVARETIPAIKRAAFELGRSVLVQGIYHSNQKQVWLDLAEACAAMRVRYCDRYLSTPLVECERRVLARRAAINNTRPYDPKNMRFIYRNVLRRYDEMIAAGFDAAWLPIDNPEEAIRTLLDLPSREDDPVLIAERSAEQNGLPI